MIFPQATYLKMVLSCLESWSDGSSGFAILSEWYLCAHLPCQIDIRALGAGSLHASPLPAHVAKPNFGLRPHVKTAMGRPHVIVFCVRAPLKLLNRIISSRSSAVARKSSGGTSSYAIFWSDRVPKMMVFHKWLASKWCCHVSCTFPTGVLALLFCPNNI